eukprot:1627403-Karenia_brevis.AAC.1
MASELNFHVDLDDIPTLTDVGTDMKGDTDMGLVGQFDFHRHRYRHVPTTTLGATRWYRCR